MDATKAKKRKAKDSDSDDDEDDAKKRKDSDDDSDDDDDDSKKSMSAEDLMKALGDAPSLAEVIAQAVEQGVAAATKKLQKRVAELESVTDRRSSVLKVVGKGDDSKEDGSSGAPPIMKAVLNKDGRMEEVVDEVQTGIRDVLRKGGRPLFNFRK
jgi:hypothetical protein